MVHFLNNLVKQNNSEIKKRIIPIIINTENSFGLELQSDDLARRPSYSPIQSPQLDRVPNQGWANFFLKM